MKILYRYTDDFMDQLESHIADVWSELVEILPKLPALDDMSFVIDNTRLIPKMNTGEAAISPTKLSIALNGELDYKEMRDEFRGLLFHEAFHLAQKWTYKTGSKTVDALEHSVGEGIACAFEKEYADSDPYYARYSQDFIDEWLPQVAKLGDDWWGEYNRWKFWDKETETNHILYRVGTYVAERAVEKSGKDIVKFANLSAKEIVELADLDLEPIRTA